MGQGAYLSTALAIRIVVREVGQAVIVVVVAAEVVVVSTRVVVLGRVASAAAVVVAPLAALQQGEEGLPRVYTGYSISSVLSPESVRRGGHAHASHPQGQKAPSDRVRERVPPPSAERRALPSSSSCSRHDRVVRVERGLEGKPSPLPSITWRPPCDHGLRARTSCTALGSACCTRPRIRAFDRRRMTKVAHATGRRKVNAAARIGTS